MSRLLYHSETSYQGGESPFDEAIRNVASSDEVWIACPYIGPTYLKSVLRTVDEWRILTDVEAWIEAFHGDSRTEITALLEAHRDRIHHFENLHAKVVLSEDLAVVGSANLTEKGIRKRTEVGVLFEDDETVTELREWFARLWSESDPADPDELETFVRASPPASFTYTPSTAPLSSNAPRVNASYVVPLEPSVGEPTDAHDDAHEAVVKRVAMAPSREWADAFFELLGDLIAATGLTTDDGHLVTSIPQKNRISISVNRRMVLGAFFSPDPRTGFILPNDTENADELLEAADGYYEFSSGGSTRGTPHWVEYEGEPKRMVDRPFRRAWIDAVHDELDRASWSPYRDSHEPLVYRAGVDQAYRRRVLDDAFPE
ncbi:phospholipase D-like domain-containing protein [Natronobiforma cellulositropha]|uniref:phospholipase D-like domain-containing protein n=1 Tax=Natronobiforma cellulositropha TaxID=1679076 RepID=UPI0021D58FC7|nr:phospholipase D family protein [Natronobiforma cellulositropha]